MPDLIAYPDVTDWLGSEVAHWKTKTREAQAKLDSLQALADRCREKDWAHSAEQAKRRETAEAERDRMRESRVFWRKFAGQLEAERDTLIDEVRALQADLEEFGEAEKRWLQFRRERDAFKAAVERGKRLAEAAKLGSSQSTSWTLSPEAILAALDVPETPEKGTESNGGGRTPQTQGATETQEANEAQEASQ